ncbi:nuclear transport factor 2 family protein [Dokdonella ginsengisoli]|uniref:Nuclear transport factor 2 family protein n=1 Tax=Dokdonella ginsengisoli TaxID=363846 RepID=A0ABV9QSJ7_9GAMM
MKAMLVVLAALAGGNLASAAEPRETSPDAPLEQTISALDTAVFDAFNHCSDPGQLEKHASYFAENVEFYHDTGGVTWNRNDMLANTRKYVCGNFTRELVPGTLQVYPIKDFGALSKGTHRFCQVSSGKCEGMADFTILWHQSGNRWEITRVLSYGHRAAAGKS